MAKGNFLTKSDIKFWLAILGIVVTGVIAFTTLRMRVEAMQDKGVKLRTEFEGTAETTRPKIELILINQTKMQKDIDYIKENIR